MKILVTGAHGDIGCSVGKIIKSEFKNCKISGVDIEDHGPGDLLFDNVFKTPHIKDKKYLRIIKKIYQKFDLIIPCSEPEIDFIVKKKLFKIFPILINKPEIVLNFDSKQKVLEFLKLNFKPLSSNYFNSIENIKYPFFLKKNKGYGNKGYYLIKNFKELKKKINYTNWIGQEYLYGKDNEYSCAVIKLLNFEKVLILNRKLHKSGFTYFAKTSKNNRLEKILINLAREIKLHGCINIQLKIIKNKFKVFDINTRLSSTVMMRHIVGFKDCVWWIKDFFKIKFSKKTKDIKNNIIIFKDSAEKILRK
jgi:carbamoyl-phosphate synthase large subunit